MWNCRICGPGGSGSHSAGGPPANRIPGYDSAGIAVRSPEKGLQVKKSKGRLQVLADLTHDGADLTGSLGIGHTRRATHGEPNDINAHPHVSENGAIALVHNGIIENYLEIKEQLAQQGVTFKIGRAHV